MTESRENESRRTVLFRRICVTVGIGALAIGLLLWVFYPGSTALAVYFGTMPLAFVAGVSVAGWRIRFAARKPESLHA